MKKTKPLKPGKKSPLTCADLLQNYYPFICKGYLRAKWSIRHRVPFLNTKLVKQMRKITSEFESNGFNGSVSGDSKRVLFFSMRQDPAHLAWGGALMIALMLRGHEVRAVACDGFIRRACNSGQYPDNRDRAYCSMCRLYSRKFYEVSPIETSWLSKFATLEDWQRAEAVLKDVKPADYDTFSYAGLPIGELARTSTIHFIRKGSIGHDGDSRAIYRDFIVGGIAMYDICGAILDKYGPDVVMMLNGWFISERIMLEVARRRNIKVITYENGFRDDTIYFCQDEPIRYRIDKHWSRYGSVELTEQQNQTLDRYLSEREGGDLGWAVYDLKAQDVESVKRSLGLDPQRKLAVAFTNIVWDSTIWRLNIGFASMMDWLQQTLAYFIDRPDIYCVVRLHPGEVVKYVISRDPVANRLRALFPTLPANIKVIESNSIINSYALMEIADLGLVYTSTTGLEMAIKGKPVLVAGDPHYRGKGFTYDIDSPDQYVQLLNLLLNGTRSGNDTNHRVELARRYAYRLFFEGCVPFDVVDERREQSLDVAAKFNFASVTELLPGRHKGLDSICHMIAQGDEH